MIEVPALTDVHVGHLIDQARTYSRGPLIEYLRNGGTVTPALAAFLADGLEGRAPKPRKREQLKRKLPPFMTMRGLREAYKELAERFRDGHLDADEKAVMKGWLKRADPKETVNPSVAGVSEVADMLMRAHFAYQDEKPVPFAYQDEKPVPFEHSLSESQLKDALRRKKRKV